jgi:hypothetical protein
MAAPCLRGGFRQCRIDQLHQMTVLSAADVLAAVMLDAHISPLCASKRRRANSGFLFIV